MRERNVQVIDSDEVRRAAKKIREDFYGKPVQKTTEHSFTWPKTVKLLGRTNAEIYFSDKMLNGGKPELYKHVAEGPQEIFINDRITTIRNDDGRDIEFREAPRSGIRANCYGLADPSTLAGPEGGSKPAVFYTRTHDVAGPIPKTVADLAENLGVQFVSGDGKYWEIRLPNTTWAAAKCPEDGKHFLLVYGPEGVHFIVTGKILRVRKEGITG